MPKDRKKYRYVDVGLERGSWTLSMFEEDARRHQMSDQPGKLIALRLTEYYELKMTSTVPSSRQLLMLNEIDGHNEDTSHSQNQAQKDTIVEISQQETENADEAADYWARL